MPPSHRRQLLEILQTALRAVNGRDAVRDFLRTAELEPPVFVIAIGKAATAMVRGAHDALGETIADALVITKEGHGEPLPWAVHEAGHPYPDARSLDAGLRLLEFIRRLPPEARVLVLLSGGASALVEVLPPGVSLAQLEEINRWLLASGLDIVSMNRIRKRLSSIKGGRLAALLNPRPVLCLAISDVPGDDPRAIGSGPLVADEALTRPVNPQDFPQHVAAALRHSAPAPGLDDECFRRVRFEVVATLNDAKRAAARAANEIGWKAVVEPDFVSGDAVTAGAKLANELLKSSAGMVRVWGGETTIRLPPAPGRGGRNQSLALAAALVLTGNDAAGLLAVGTDGTDGPTGDAGALVDGGTIGRGETAGCDPQGSLARADAGTFLEASGDLIHTGPTGTNVMDLIIGLRSGK